MSSNMNDSIHAYDDVEQEVTVEQPVSWKATQRTN